MSWSIWIKSKLVAFDDIKTFKRFIITRSKIFFSLEFLTYILYGLLSVRVVFVKQLINIIPPYSPLLIGVFAKHSYLFYVLWMWSACLLSFIDIDSHCVSTQNHALAFNVLISPFKKTTKKHTTNCVLSIVFVNHFIIFFYVLPSRTFDLHVMTSWAWICLYELINGMNC